MSNRQPNHARIAWVVLVGRVLGLAGVAETGFGFMVLLFSGGDPYSTLVGFVTAACCSVLRLQGSIRLPGKTV